MDFFANETRNKLIIVTVSERFLSKYLEKKNPFKQDCQHCNLTLSNDMEVVQSSELRKLELKSTSFIAQSMS